MKPPRIFKDLYSDLRDRRLLPVVIILLLATLALPFLLRTDPEPISATTPAPVPEADAAPTLPAVLASNPTLRDYRERLDSLSSKNPFAGDAPQGTGAAPESAAAAPVEAASESASATASGGGGSSSFSEAFSETVTESSAGGGGGATPVQEDDVVEADDSGGSSSSGGSGGGGSTSGGGTRWFTFSVDVLTGPAGDTRRRNDLQNLTVLPSKSNPVAVYIGVTESGKGAIFMLSPDVVGTSGGGSCMPSPSRCQFLTLKEGQEQKLDYAPSGEPDTYILDVKDIRFEEIEDPRDKRGEGMTEGARDGLSAFAD
jgi:hypothetical protein